MVLADKPVESLCPFEYTEFPERFWKKAEDELNETPESKENGIAQLRDLIQSHPDLNCRTTEEFLVQFLRARKFNIPRSFDLLKKYMNFKRKNMNIFTGMDYESLEKLERATVMRFFPYRCEDGCAVVGVHFVNWCPTESSIDEFCRMIVLNLYHSINDPLTQINGYKILLDAKCNPCKHLRFCTPYYIRLLYNILQESFPGRFKGIHVFNISIAFKIAWQLIQPFLSDKLKERFVFHDNYKSVQEYFPLTMIPIDFGGQLNDSRNIQWIRTALQEENLEKIAN